MKKIIFYISVSKKIGFGHLIRSSALAERYKKKGFNCILAIDNNIDLKLINQKIFSKILILSWFNQKKTAEKLTKIYKKLNCDYLILDHISVSEIFQKVILYKKIKWLQFDNSKKIKFYSNQIINQNLNCNYKKNTQQKYYCGRKYIILRSEFYKKKSNKNKLSDIFICFGGGENFHKLKYIYNLLYVLNVSNKLHFVINDIKTYCKFKNLINRNKNKLKIRIYIKQKYLSNIMDKCKFSINSSGMISHELNSRNVFMMLLSVSKNQEQILKKWKKLGHCILGKFLKKNTKIHIKKIKEVLSMNKNYKNSNYVDSQKGINEIVNDTIRIIQQ